MLLLLLACAKSPGAFSDGGDDNTADAGSTTTWSFDDSTDLPADVDVVDGTWAVAADDGATSSPNVLRQTGTGIYPRVLVRDVVYADATISVRCRPESGSEDQACGLLFRAVDSDNYLVTRANVLENNIRLYTVKAGNRVEFASADATVTGNEWHTLAVTLTGDAITVKWDDAIVLDETESSFPDPGHIGIWVKADSVTAFDDLTAVAAP